MSLDYVVERTSQGILLNRENVEKLNKIVFVEGLCAANKIDPERSNGMISVEDYKRNVVVPGIKDGTIEINSKYDDRKIRFHSSKISSNILEVSLGFTYFGANKEDINRDSDENLKLKEIGKRRFDDEYAFLERTIGVTTVAITNERDIFLGERKNVATDLGVYNVASGYVEYNEDINMIDLEWQAREELNEEYGVAKGDISEMKFVGVFSNPVTGEIDFSYLASIELSNKELLSAWDNSKDKEHGKRIKISNYGELEQVLKNIKLMYATRGVLDSIRPGELEAKV
jgi:hypothetical protein